MDSIIVLLFLLWSAQLDGKRQSGPDPEQGGEIDVQKGPSPGGKPCGKVGWGKEAGESASIDIGHQHAHKGAKQKRQNSGGHHGKGNGPWPASESGSDRIPQPV